ncbi:MAG: cytochrome c-type biogenesis protein CcmH [Thiotrichaceae bacterium]|nr:cytochrome c-type biogenesis protein CcmH [Thiotrichaceae bacterium]
MLLKIRQIMAILALSLWVSSVQGGIEVRHFDNPEQEVLYDQLMYELRCLVCQNENLAASNAPLAKDLRDEVYLMITEQNLGEIEIKKFLVDRYTDFVLYRPPLKKTTWLLWFGPFIMLFLGGVLAFFFIRSNRSKGKKIDEEENDITQNDRDKIKSLLEGNK